MPLTLGRGGILIPRKKLLRIRSVNIIVIAPANTVSDNNNSNNSVCPTAQTNKQRNPFSTYVDRFYINNCGTNRYFTFKLINLVINLIFIIIMSNIHLLKLINLKEISATTKK